MGDSMLPLIGQVLSNLGLEPIVFFKKKDTLLIGQNVITNWLSSENWVFCQKLDFSPKLDFSAKNWISLPKIGLF